MAKKNDAGAGFFFRREDSIVVGVEQMENRLVSLLPPSIFKDPDVSAAGERPLHSLREPHRPVVSICMVDKAAYKTNHDIGRGCVRCSAERTAICRPGN